MNLRKLIALATLLGALGIPALSVHAADATGIYLGAGIGQSTLEDDDLSASAFDESDTAWKAFLGYHLDFIPVVKAALEVGYRDLGNPAAAGSTVEIRGWDYSALVGIGLGPIEVFGRLGQMKYDFTTSGVPSPTETDGTANILGAGLSFVISKVGVRAEYEQIDIDELDDAAMVSLSAMLQF
jgi:Outer membrane protein beta-barrel domain